MSGMLVTLHARRLGGNLIMQFIYDDGGRAVAGFRGKAGDCVVRSIAIATGKQYLEVYDAINAISKAEGRKRKSSSRNGVFRKTAAKYLESIGWAWHPTMQVGQGCRVHLLADEIPTGRLIVRLSKHFTAVIDHVIHDTFDPQRVTHWYENGKLSRIGYRCVYGYFFMDGKDEN